LNYYYSLGLKEDKVILNSSFVDKIVNQNVKDILLKFEESTKTANDYRNGFTHRFTPNIPDNRSSIIRDNMELKFNAGRFVSSDKIVENINDSVRTLSNFIRDLKEYVNDNQNQT
jgi:hypothetical protein